MSRAPLRVAVLGAGTVGREVVRALLDHPRAAVRRRRRAAGACRGRLPRPRPGATRRNSRGAADRRAGPPGGRPGHGRHRRADGRRRAGPDVDRGGPLGRQAGRDRQQARRRSPRAGPRGGRPARRGRLPVRGRGRRRDPGARAAGHRPGGQRRGPGARHRQRHHQLHPQRDGRRGTRLRRCPGRGPGAWLCRGGSGRRRRGRRRGQQAGDPRPARLRPLAAAVGRRPPPIDGAGHGPAGDQRCHGSRACGGRGLRPDDQAPGVSGTDRATRSLPACCRPRSRPAARSG